MNQDKLEILRNEIKLKRLAELTNLTQLQLSRILHRIRPTDQKTALRLAKLANQMSLRINYFTVDDFYHIEEE